MNRKIFLSGFAALSIAAIAVFNLGLVSKSSGMSDVSMANIEALAWEASSSGHWTVTSVGVIDWKCKDGGSKCCPNIITTVC
jgi:hypothetical protein